MHYFETATRTTRPNKSNLLKISFNEIQLANSVFRLDKRMESSSRNLLVAQKTHA